MDNINGFNPNEYQEQAPSPVQFQSQPQVYPQKNPTLNRDVILTVVQFLIIRNLITGIISLACTLTANDKFCAGLYQDYEKYTKYGKVARIVGYVLFGCIVIMSIFIFSVFTAGMADVLESL